MAPIRRLVIDMLKPHDPSTVEITARIADLEGVDGANASLVETDREVQNLTLTVEGPDVDHDAVEATVDRLGGAVHSVDQVICGERVVESAATPQD
jgi:hypothetical protein